MITIGENLIRNIVAPCNVSLIKRLHVLKGVTNNDDTYEHHELKILSAMKISRKLSFFAL